MIQLKPYGELHLVGISAGRSMQEAIDQGFEEEATEGFKQRIQRSRQPMDTTSR
jgi:hypothetical protein